MPMIGCVTVLMAALAAVPAHPRMFANSDEFSALKVRLETSELGRKCRARLVNEAERMLQFPLPVYAKDKAGIRILAISQSAIGVVGKSAMAYRLTGDRRYADRAIAEAMSVSAFPDWNPSHFLDTAEMTFAVALCYDWLYDELTSSQRETMYQAILHKGLVKSDGSLYEGWWLMGDNNWCQVCNGGMVAGAVAIAEREPQLVRKVIDRALESLPRAMAKFAPDGGFPEGPAYWVYAMRYNVIAIELIERFDGTDHGLCSLPGFASEVEYLDACTGSTGLPFNFSDAGALSLPVRYAEFSQFWLARRFSRHDTLVFHEFGELRRYLDTPIPAQRADRSYDRFFPLLLLNLPETHSKAEVRTPLCRVIGGENPIAVMRTSWTDRNAWFVGLKGGKSGISHGHMDVGSFVLDAEGVRWVVDIGNDRYANLESSGLGEKLWEMTADSPRWKIFRLSLEGHGTLQFNDEQQNPQATAQFSPIVDGETTLDLSGSYGRDVRRTFKLGRNGGFSVKDAIRGAKPGDRVTWRINTLAEVTVDGPRATLAQKDANGQLRKLQVSAQPADVKFSVVDCSKRKREYESDNPGLSQLYFVMTVPASGSLDFAVELSY